MVLEPPLLLADEPTGNLDSNTGREINELFFEMNKERGTTILIVTHNPKLAELMPRCLRMEDGGLVDGAPL
jgi:predicted ABC-type transport system involved in lysophospholipase L1 biosynthesis ATPase subunit